MVSNCEIAIEMFWMAESIEMANKQRSKRLSNDFCSFLVFAMIRSQKRSMPLAAAAAWFGEYVPMYRYIDRLNSGTVAELARPTHSMLMCLRRAARSRSLSTGSRVRAENQKRESVVSQNERTRWTEKLVLSSFRKVHLTARAARKEARKRNSERRNTFSRKRSTYVFVSRLCK